MGKRLFLLIAAILVGVAWTPGFLTADDTLRVLAPEFHAVETVPLPEPEVAEPVIVKQMSYEVSAAKYAPVESAAPQMVNYTVTAYIGSAQEYSNTVSSLSYGDIYKFQKMIYGHNSGNLLGNLSGRYVGEIITITEGGVAKSYRVADVVTYAKTADGNLENNPSLMRGIAYSAMGHDVALMTCAGQSYGNGDASHRLVVYADAV